MSISPFTKLAAAACGAAAIACGAAPEPEPDFHGDEPVGEQSFAQTVAEAISGGCSTTSVAGLSQQIIDQMNCLIPGGALVEVPARPNFVKGGATLAWMQPPAVAALVAALDEMPTTEFRSNSMLRTVAQQYLLYRWYQNGTCNISLAATPGNSNHESGLAIDVSQNATWRSTLEAHDFTWLGSNDPVHFDYTGPGIVDLSGKDVQAFQQLWNLNHPEDPIAEDGEYGPATGARLEQSPAEGFAVPPNCGAGGTGGTGGVGGVGGAGAQGGVGGAGGSGASGGAGGSGFGGSAGTAGSGGAPGTGGAGFGGSSGSGVGGSAAGGAGFGGSGALGGSNSGGTGVGGSAGSAPSRASAAESDSGCACGVVRAPSFADSRWLGLGAVAGFYLALSQLRRRRR